MSILTVSVSHRTAALDTLAAVSMDAAAASKLADALVRSDHLGDGLAEDAAGLVDLGDGVLGRRDLGRPEVGQLAALREHVPELEDPVLAAAAAGVGVLAAVVAAAAGREGERGNGGECQGAEPSAALHGRLQMSVDSLYCVRLYSATEAT